MCFETSTDLEVNWGIISAFDYQLDQKANEPGNVCTEDFSDVIEYQVPY